MNFDAFFSLCAYARVPTGRFGFACDSEAAFSSRKIFCHVVCNTPQLFIRWPLLIQRYSELVWTSHDEDYHSSSSISDNKTLLNELLKHEKIARHNGIQLPPKQLVRRINKEELKIIQ